MDQDKHLRQIRNTRQNCQADAQNLTYDGAEFNYDNIMYNLEWFTQRWLQPVLYGPVNLRNLSKYFNLENAEVGVLN